MWELPEWYTIKIGKGSFRQVYDNIPSAFRAFTIANKHRYDPTMVIEYHRKGDWVEDPTISFYELEMGVKEERFFGLAFGRGY